LSSSLTWQTFVSGSYVNYFQWNWHTYYGGNDYSSPTSASTNQAFPAGANYYWDAGFGGVPSPLFGQYHVTLNFAGGCTVSSSVNVPTPTPTLMVLTVS